MIFSDETTIRLNTVKRLIRNSPGKKKITRAVKYSTKVNVGGCFSTQGSTCIVCFKQNFNAKLICDIYKRGTVQQQFGLNSTVWKLQEDNDAKRRWKVGLNWKASHRIQKFDWPSMSPDLAPIENV